MSSPPKPPIDRTAHLRLAILSALADQFGRASAGERPAFRRFAGKSVLSHQIDCAAHLGCDRILCMAGGLGPEMGTARAYAERAGVRFDITDSLLRLASQVTAGDEVVVLADGVLPDRAALVGALGARPGVIAFPAEPALELGFERIDVTRAWSGALRMRGAEVARLADLPPDCELASSLLRIALQAGVPVVDLDASCLSDTGWQRRVERHATTDAERRWITRQVSPAPFTAPGLALADRMGLRWAHDAGGGRWARAPHWAAGLAGLLALGAALMSWPLAGLALLLAASFALAVTKVFERVETLGAPPRSPGAMLPLVCWLRDGLLVFLLALLVEAEPAWLRLVLPLNLLALLRLGAAIAQPGWRPLFADRIALIAVLLTAAWQGWAAPVTAALSLIALASLLWAAHRPRAQLTAD